jgi:hypothetical protein
MNLIDLPPADKGSAVEDTDSPHATHWLMRTREGTEFVTKHRYTWEQVQNWECSEPVMPLTASMLPCAKTNRS